ncbi:MAG: AAA-associated domain-containing protein [Firmicutes bacterium]|nr:AAA-associated domain-containing protein [Bacillota bacterium]
MDIVPLPRAGIGTVIGLMEILDDSGGRDDVFRLAKELQMELDDILPVIEAGKLLGFLQVVDGDLMLTDVGKTLLRSDINQRKDLLWDQLLKIKVFQEVVAALKSRSRLRIKRDFFVDLFEQKMSDKDAAQFFKTVVDWGRYAELIGYDPEEEIIYLDTEE